MNEKMLTTEELRQWLQIGRTTLWRWRKEGMPYIKYGNSVRFNKDDVLKWLSENNKK